MDSIWRMECEFPKREQLTKDMKVEVAIVGAGMVGILTAYLLKQKGIDAVILEANEIASGQTQNTTAKITSQHGVNYDKLITHFGKEKALYYAAANEEAISMYENIIKENNISCHFERLPSYLYTLNDAEKIEKEVDAARSLAIDAEFTTDTTLPFDVKGAVKFNNQAMFHPLEFLQEIVKHLNIYEHTMVRDIKDQIILTDHGKVKANHIVLSCHYPFINIPGYYFARMHQERSYVLCINNTPKLDGMYKDESDTGFSFRNYKDMILLGGGEHRTGENPYGGKYEKLRFAAKEFYPDFKEVCYWSAQDCKTIDSVPYIGQFSASTPNMYVATGFKKWGMTHSMVSAKILSDMIAGTKNTYEELYTPQRFQVTASVKSLLDESKHAATGILLEKFKLPDTKIDEVKNGQGAVIDYEGEKIGVYKDTEGKVYMVSTKCTHLGCQLDFNPDELSWDCPCHGSRFDYTGKLINNPALENIQHV
jgi:glycine/D-amino acid oxidase-like deaminating enzyme/nitrite reductase/ring-hydroxylating ferredoxin subunit